MNFKSYLVGAATALAIALGATQANAAVLTIGTGWVEDQINSANSTSVGSPWTFTASGSGFLTLSDCCQPSDFWTVSGSFAGVSSLTLLPTNFPLGLGDTDYDSEWTNPILTRLQFAFGPGSYSFSVLGNGSGGIPAHFGLRADISAIPLPGALPLFATGLAALGLLGWRRKKKAAAVAA